MLTRREVLVAGGALIASHLRIQGPTGSSHYDGAILIDGLGNPFADEAFPHYPQDPTIRRTVRKRSALPE